MMITGLYAGILGILFITLCYGVILKRLKYKIGLGHGDNHELHKAIRVQGNFVEYVPIALLLIALCDFSNIPPEIVHGFGITLVLGRILHAYALNKTSQASKMRVIGTLMTHAVIVVCSIILIYQFAIA